MNALALILLVAQETVPFEFVEGKILVEAKVNGKGPYTFAVDTGSPVVVVPASEKSLTISVGTAEVRDPEVHVKKSSGDLYGVLGNSFLSKFVVTIDYQKRTLTLVPIADGGPYVGLSPRALGADEANEIGIDGGVVVHKMAKGSPAERGGLKEKDIIQEMNGKRIDTVDDYYAIVKKSKPGDTITFSVIRDKKDVEVKVVVGSKK